MKLYLKFQKVGSEDEGGLKIVENEEKEKTAERSYQSHQLPRKLALSKLSKSLKRHLKHQSKHARIQPRQCRAKALIDWTQVNSDESDQEKKYNRPFKTQRKNSIWQTSQVNHFSMMIMMRIVTKNRKK